MAPRTLFYIKKESNPRKRSDARVHSLSVHGAYTCLSPSDTDKRAHRYHLKKLWGTAVAAAEEDGKGETKREEEEKRKGGYERRRRGKAEKEKRGKGGIRKGARTGRGKGGEGKGKEEVKENEMGKMKGCGRGGEGKEQGGGGIRTGRKKDKRGEGN